MTDKLPILSGKDVIKALGKLGYTVNDQKGSHIHLRHPVRRPLTVPNHPKLPVGLCGSSLKTQILPLKNFWNCYNSQLLRTETNPNNEASYHIFLQLRS
jgi:predicted RNA binding protein YcfA (HicA-like mRNA interferase family)